MRNVTKWIGEASGDRADSPAYLLNCVICQQQDAFACGLGCLVKNLGNFLALSWCSAEQVVHLAADERVLSMSCRGAILRTIRFAHSALDGPFSLKHPQTLSRSHAGSLGAPTILHAAPSSGRPRPVPQDSDASDSSSQEVTLRDKQDCASLQGTSSLTDSCDRTSPGEAFQCQPASPREHAGHALYLSVTA